MADVTPNIKIYTNHGCPWAHRAHIALSELNIPYDEEIIDLSKPRTPEYLRINPRGLVPALDFNGEIITESAVVATFLADAFPSKLLPVSTDPQGPLTRARISFFVDAYFSKAQVHFSKALVAKSDDDEKAAVAAYVDAISKEVEPLLADAAPFFGGSDKLTLAEVLTGSFILRLYALTKHGVAPASILEGLSTKAPNFEKWAKEVIKHPSVLSIWDEDSLIPELKAFINSQKTSG
ncbi:thioredoxin-like protein [Polychaeton citri CBS 116435]|uniref:Thioredoxin-like protein n=1 Tax=Polychaeton citri CBS 116435 TaxID=1314669 RepID=A0A9P4Q6Y9_9PEZI|nr:thioredoxin-like protein [Polychaeton citri CBS 116435]